MRDSEGKPVLGDYVRKKYDEDKHIYQVISMTLCAANDVICGLKSDECAVNISWLIKVKPDHCKYKYVRIKRTGEVKVVHEHILQDDTFYYKMRDDNSISYVEDELEDADVIAERIKDVKDYEFYFADRGEMANVISVNSAEVFVKTDLDKIESCSWHKFNIYKKQQYYNGKVIALNKACGWLTKGKIYDVVDGQFLDDVGEKEPCFKVRTFNALCDSFVYQKFAEVTEEQEGKTLYNGKFFVVKSKLSALKEGKVYNVVEGVFEDDCGSAREGCSAHFLSEIFVSILFHI